MLLLIICTQNAPSVDLGLFGVPLGRPRGFLPGSNNGREGVEPSCTTCFLFLPGFFLPEGAAVEVTGALPVEEGMVEVGRVEV